MERPSGLNFAFWALSCEKRKALSSVHEFCRAVDDAVEAGEPTRAASQVAFWRREVELLYEGADRPSHPVTAALRTAVERYDLPRAPFASLLDAAESDLRVTRYETFPELETYLLNASASVELLGLSIFYGGAAVPEASRGYARGIGCALQLTRILRDVSDDLALGRVYLPQEDLARFGVSEADLRWKRYTPGFIELMRFEHARAAAYHAAARAGLEPDPALLPAELLSAAHEALLEKMRRVRFAVLDERVELTAAEKVGAALKRRAAFTFAARNEAAWSPA